MSRPTTSVVVPVYRNADTLQALHARLQQVLGLRGGSYEMVFVDDACPGGSLPVLRALEQADAHVRVVALPANGGQQRALLEGLRHAQGEQVVLMDADLQDPPEAIGALLEALDDGASAAFATRRGAYQGWGRRVTSWLLKHLVHWVCGMPPDAGVFMAMDRRMVERVLALDDPAPFLPVMVACAGLPVACIPVQRATRPCGKSAYSGAARLKAGWRALACAVRQRRRHALEPAEILGLLMGTLLCLPLMLAMLRLDRVDLGSPMEWCDDAFYYLVLARSLVENGLTLANPSLGAPHGMSLADTPVLFSSLHWATLRMVAMFTSNPARVVNLYYLASFPLITLSSLVACRRLGFSWPTALVVALLFAFSPYHFARGLQHLFLGTCYLVPLACLVALWTCEGLAGKRKRVAAAAVVCAALGAGGPYYALFTAFFLGVAGMCAAWRERRPRLLLEPLLLVTLIAMVGVAQVIPAREWYRQHGRPPVLQRDAAEADLYGLRVAQMLMPVQGHVVPPLAGLRQEYDKRRPPEETGPSSLGIVACVGFVTLLAVAFGALARGTPPGEGLLHRLSLLHLSGLLLATVGGLGSLVALAFLPQIRCYNRMSIFLGFLSLLAVGVLLERARARWPRWGTALCVVVALIGLLDQRGPQAAREQQPALRDYASDQAFVRAIEGRLPRGSAVFQLPVVPFIEGRPVLGSLSYDAARGYCASNQLRWSYGVPPDGEGELWQRQVAAMPLPRMLDTLCLSGFAGLWLDRRGYPDRTLEEGIARELGATASASSDDRFAFFDLSARGQALRRGLSTHEWELAEEDALYPVLPLWRDGFSGREEAGTTTWRWCSGRGRLELVNRSHRPRVVTLIMTLAEARGEPVHIESPAFSATVRADGAGTALCRSVAVPPGGLVIHFSCAAMPLDAPGDSRRMVFQVRNLQIH